MLPFPVALATGIYPPSNQTHSLDRFANRWGTDRDEGRIAFAALANPVKRGVRVTGAIGTVFLIDAKPVADSWLVGAGVFPPGASGEGESRDRVGSEAV